MKRTKEVEEYRKSVCKKCQLWFAVTHMPKSRLFGRASFWLFGFLLVMSPKSSLKSGSVTVGHLPPLLHFLHHLLLLLHSSSPKRQTP